jgi:hypothetical protein
MVTALPESADGDTTHPVRPIDPGNLPGPAGGGSAVSRGAGTCAPTKRVKLPVRRSRFSR